jgi:hypothetical protein
MDHPRVDRARADRVDSDALPGDVAGGGLGQADHRVLRGDIGRHPRGRHQPGDPGGVDDGTPLLLQHDRKHVMQAEEDTLDVDANHRVEHVLVIFGGVRPFTFGPGIVEKGVDGTIGVERAFDIGPHLGHLVTSAATKRASLRCCRMTRAVASPAAASRSTTTTLAPLLAKPIAQLTRLLDICSHRRDHPTGLARGNR